MEEIGILIVTPQGLEAVAKSLRMLGGKSARLKVWKTPEGIRLSCNGPESGWIDIEKGWLD